MMLPLAIAIAIAIAIAWYAQNSKVGIGLVCLIGGVIL
jgi:hypothetical protein